MMRRCWRALVVVAAVAAAGEGTAFACSFPSPGPACRATWNVDAVFTGTVQSMTPIADESLGVPRQSMLVRFSVERGFVNIRPGSAEVVTGMGGGDCGYQFKVGSRYLVYAWKKGSRLSTGISTRTRPINEAREDLQYLSTLSGSSTGGHIYGRINEFRRDPAEDRGVDYGPVEGITVSLRSATFARDVVTNADGRFDLSPVPVGKMTLNIVPPFGFEPSSFEQEIDIKDPRACDQVDLTIQPLARASGIVVDVSGRPLAGIVIDAVAAELAGFNPQAYQRPSRSNQQGVFEFRDLPPGSYVFGVNLTEDPSSASPRGTPVFLPGTSVARKAVVIQLSAGDRKDVGTLRLLGR